MPSLEVDVSDLEIGSAILVRDLPVPDGIEILSDPEEMVAQISVERMAEAVVEEEVPLVMEEELPEVEIISRGVSDEEEEAK